MNNSLGLLSEIRKRVGERKRLSAERDRQQIGSDPVNPVRSDGGVGKVTAIVSDQIDPLLRGVGAGDGTADQNNSTRFEREEKGTAGEIPEKSSSAVKTNMAAPMTQKSQQTLDTIDRNLRSLLEQGPLLTNVQTAVVAIDKRLKLLENKRSGEETVGESSNKKQKTCETPKQKHIPSLVPSPSNPSPSNVSEQPGSSGLGLISLEEALSEGEIEIDNESELESADSEDEFLNDLQSFYKETEEEGVPVSSDIAPIINKGLRVMGQQEALKKLREKHCHPNNVGNIKIPKVNPVVWRTLSTKGKCVDAAIQKSMTKFSAAITPVVRQIDLLSAHKKEVKKNPLLHELKQLTMDTMHMLSHAVTSSNQMRKDAVKSELHPKFHKLCNPDHPVSESQLFGDQLQTELKDLDEEKRYHLGKSRPSSSTTDKSERKSSSDQGFRRGYGKNHQPPRRTQFSDKNQTQSVRGRYRGRWSSQKRQ